MNSRRVLCVSLIAGAAWALLLPASSSAAWRRVSAGACTAGGNNGRLTDLDSDHWISSEAGYGVTGNDSMSITCPLEDTSDFPKTFIERINVHTFDGTSAGNNFGRTWVCGTSAFIFDSACLAAEAASGSGHKQLTLSTSQEIGWITAAARSDYFASLHVLLFSTSGAQQRFKGYWVTD